MRALLCYRCMHVVSLTETQLYSCCPCGNCTMEMDDNYIEDHTMALCGYQLDGYFIKDADTLEDIIRSKVRNKITVSQSEQLFLMERGQDEDSKRYPYEV